MHILLIQATIKDLKVTTTAINVLFMLHGELDDKWLVFVSEWREFFGQGIETSIL